MRSFPQAWTVSDRSQPCRNRLRHEQPKKSEEKEEKIKRLVEGEGGVGEGGEKGVGGGEESNQAVALKRGLRPKHDSGIMREVLIGQAWLCCCCCFR